MTLPEFVSLSAVLTGYPASTLQPAQDTQLVAQQLFEELSKPSNAIPPDQLTALTNTWNSISNTPPGSMEQVVQDQIMNNPAISRLAQNIILMWYLGNWYDLLKNPNSYTFPAGVPADHVNQDHVVSSSIYINSLVWSEMGAHPMGSSTGVFGYWANNPIMPTI